MSKSWFYKLLFSYLPLFFVIISFLVAVFFLSIGEVTRKAAETLNRSTSEHILEIVDHSLRTVEHMMIKELGTNDGIKRFYNQALLDDPYQRMVKPAQKLDEIITQYPLVDSIYMVNWADDTVLTDTSSMSVERFEDRAMIQGYLDNHEGASWTGVREYKEFVSQQTSQVLTLIKPYPVPAGDQGIMVVNISVDSLYDQVKGLYDTGFIAALLEDANGNRLYASDPNHIFTNGSVEEVSSSYSGLRIKSQLHSESVYFFASRLNWILLISGLVSILAAVFFITYISKRNYRPIQSLTERLQGYSRLKAEQLLKSGVKDEFSLIESAVDKMIAQSNELLIEQEHHLQVRRRHWIKETLEGEYDMIMRDWAAVSTQFGWQEELHKTSAIVLEIDCYLDFCERYSKRDQSLLKFLIGNVAAEMADHWGMSIFGEWIQVDKWCAFIQLQDRQTTEDVALFARQIVQWICGNLDFQITASLGETTPTHEEISSSYEQALHGLDYKMTLGSGRVIASWELPEQQGNNGSIAMTVEIRRLVQAFKLGEKDWEAAFDHYFLELRQSVLPKDEVMYQVNYLVYQMSKELEHMSNDYRRVWEQASTSINMLIRQQDTIDGLSDGLRQILRDMNLTIESLREDRSYSTAMQSVRQYIQIHYANPELSLNHLSVEFELAPKYVSQLFKEEFGEKFVDYLASVRIDHAKRMLIATDYSIQDIALQVGYGHSFSFIRVFKKLVGMTPGDFRKRETH